ncbi:MAG: kelch repeat-containing protein, partial [Bacteroidales bacterium]|nr:kelch repeat-containing protein [Bacteroidales bacterium]
MKKISFVILIAIIFVALACNKESENYSFYRPSHPQNFKTKTGGELYAYTANDSTITRADYYLQVQGKIKTYGSKIVEYGHCYSSTNSNPIIGSASFKKYDGVILESSGIDTATYISSISELVPSTKYYVRSYVKELKGENDTVVGYNPIVIEITTLPAIDEWFEQTGSGVPLNGTRFDAVAFNFGDSLFFGTGNTGQAIITRDMFMYNPSTNAWEGLPPLPNINLTDAVGFGIEFKDNISQQGTKVRCIYV